MKNDDLFMTGTSGVYQTTYADQKITVRLFEAPELMEPQGQSIFCAMVSYGANHQLPARKELDQVPGEMIEHLRTEANKALVKEGLQPWGELFKSYMARAYWGLIK